MGWYGLNWVSYPGQDTTCMEFACFPCACVDFLHVLRFPPTFQTQVGQLAPVYFGPSMCTCAWATRTLMCRCWWAELGSIRAGFKEIQRNLDNKRKPHGNQWETNLSNQKCPFSGLIGKVLSRKIAWGGHCPEEYLPVQNVFVVTCASLGIIDGRKVSYIEAEEILLLFMMLGSC